jgi:hypothetical protein
MALKRFWLYVVYVLKYLAYLLLGVFFLLVLSCLPVIKDGQNFYTQVQSGKNAAEQAWQQAQAKDFKASQISIQTAGQDFTNAQATWKLIQTKFFPARIPLIADQFYYVNHVLDASILLSSSFYRGETIVINIQSFATDWGQKKFGDLPDAERQKILQYLGQINPELTGLKANLDLSSVLLDQVPKYSLIWPFYSRLSLLQGELKNASALFDYASTFSQLTKVLGGYPQAQTFLVMFQNNDELRPSGGFWGSYGLLTIQDGNIKNFFADDVYNLDKEAIGKMKTVPPLPLKNAFNLENLYLRDCNWSPDWPTAAKTAQDFYTQESQAASQTPLKIDGVIGITPQIVHDLIAITGPITVDGSTYDENNFQDLLQYNVEVGFVKNNIPKTERKKIINDVFYALKGRLENLPLSNLSEIAHLLEINIAERNLLFYFDDSGQQAIASSLGLDGSIIQTPGDYLMVVDANLKSYKSDSVIKKQLAYTLSADQAGLAAQVNLTYTHEGGYDWRTTRYHSYTRIYAPFGSRLLSSQGTGPIDVVDDKSLNKTSFGFSWTIEPGQTVQTSLKYSLPTDLAQQILTSGAYSLYWQKQAGSRIDQIKGDIKVFGRDQTFSADNWLKDSQWSFSR